MWGEVKVFALAMPAIINQQQQQHHHTVATGPATTATCAK